jgi:divalent metal cation (Fe/Co/Zn/Cd) transporter
VVLARRTKELLIGESAYPAVQTSILKIANAQRGIVHANGVLTMQLGPHQVVAALSAEFDDKLTTTEIEACVNSLEKQIREAQPEIAILFVKPQTSAVWQARRKVIEAGDDGSE